MREIASSGTIAVMRPCLVAALVGLSACNLPGYEDWQGGANSGSSIGPSGDIGSFATSTGTEPADAGSGSGGGDTTWAGSDTAEEGPPVGDAEKPEIVSVALPEKIDAAGPVPLSVQTLNTGSVRVFVDDADVGELIAADDGLFTGVLAVRGAVDNGSHTVEIVAKQGPYKDTQSASYAVSTPEPGSVAWTMEGQSGSRTNRVAVAPAGHLIGVGQTEIATVPRPSLQLRSSLTGAELAPEVILDMREGTAVDVAVREDGRMWVAMNIHEPNNDARVRIALLDADGTPTGIEVMGAVGRVVRAIAADPEGGCFAVGVAGTMGDWDAAFWRIDPVGTQKLSDLYDYQPPNFPPHQFVDLANDVVLAGDVAYVIGVSTGSHDGKTMAGRGLVVAMDRQTGESLATLIAPEQAYFTQSAFFGAALHSDGDSVLVTGYGADQTNSMYRIETSIYNWIEGRTLHLAEQPSAGFTFGSDIVLDSQGRAVVVGSVMQAGKSQAYLFARMPEPQGALLFEHWFVGGGPSEALGLARDVYDRIYPVGYFTSNGSERGQTTLIHG